VGGKEKKSTTRRGNGQIKIFLKNERRGYLE
jgi:hypothetical protein